MQVREIMSNHLVCCTPDTPLADVARLMVENDCGQIPVVGSDDRRPVGVVTDRDIACRAVAKGRNPLDLTARDCMSSPVVTVSANAGVDECCQTMAGRQVRRLPVIDENGECCGIVAQADIARVASENVAGRVVREVSREIPAASRVS